MPGYLLTAATQATCPHGAPVSFVPSQTSVLADGAPVLLASDQATIAGCPFIVGTVASPCLTIRWLAPATRVMVTRTPVLLSTSTGLCLNPASAPQGPAQLSSYQQRVQGT
ncbi:MAG TPA: hypothetical protein VH857_06095 [Actinomycetes bacterium]|jgi:hypothetical protein|nr:hypothetical protein [Actinomycetes bacterium]